MKTIKLLGLKKDGKVEYIPLTEEYFIVEVAVPEENTKDVLASLPALAAAIPTSTSEKKEELDMLKYAEDDTLDDDDEEDY